MCEHLEVDDFGIYSIDVGGGRSQQTTLLRCSACQEYVTTDGREIRGENILSRESISKTKMRTIMSLLNTGIYQELEDLLARESGNRKDPSKIMNEIVALGLKHYRISFA